MAFLDNSGDIILDAVLTETGRRKMANGNFSITKFALGDDEIDYSLYNKNHPSGSAYYDLQILQTPIFEAFTQVNAGINYGLLSTTATDLLYLPIMKTNELTGLDVGNIASFNGMFYVVDTAGNTGTSATTAIGQGLAAQATPIKSMAGTTSTTNFVLMETGLDTGFGNIPVGTSANRSSYLVANNLIDSTFYVFYDSRFISGIVGLSDTSTFNNSETDNQFGGSVSLTEGTSTSLSLGLDNYSSYRVKGIADEIIWDSSSNTEATYSVIGGPRGSVCGVAPIVKTGLDAEYTLYGTVKSGIMSTGGPALVDYIDTTIYVQGTLSSAQIQIPVRIIRISTS
jgi:hypothetical protein